MTANDPVIRVLFRQYLPGDVLKQKARSNITPSGGGARDLRFHHATIAPVIPKMFPATEQRRRRRGGMQTNVSVRVGTLLKSGRSVTTQKLVYELPTDARPWEGRITRIHQISALGQPLSTLEQQFVVLAQHASGNLTIQLETQNTLRRWPAAIAEAIRLCRETTDSDHAAQGYVDLASGASDCHHS